MWLEKTKRLWLDVNHWPVSISDLVIHIVAKRNAPMKGITASV